MLVEGLQVNPESSSESWVEIPDEFIHVGCLIFLIHQSWSVYINLRMWEIRELDETGPRRHFHLDTYGQPARPSEIL